MATAQDFSGTGYDLVTMFDALHDMGDPVAAARRVRAALADDGTWLVVEPAASDALEENLHPVGRLYYAGSLFLCVPNASRRPAGTRWARRRGRRRSGRSRRRPGSPGSGGPRRAR